MTAVPEHDHTSREHAFRVMTRYSLGNHGLNRGTQLRRAILSLCPELNVSSFGDTPGQALDSLKEAKRVIIAKLAKPTAGRLTIAS